MIALKLTALASFKRALSADAAAFLGGIVFGSKVGISDTLKQMLSVTGTTHLIAVSGYKVTLVIVTTGELFLRFLNRRAAIALAVVSLALFVLMVGFEASAIRAAVMGIIALVAREAGETFDMRNAIAFTAFGMALQNPTILTNDLSFVISFLAVLGIVYLGPPFKILFHFENDGLFGWKEAAITTLSAQLATMPVLMNAFGRFSLIAIPANVFTLSLLPLTMCLGCMLACLGLASNYLAFAAAKLAGLLVGYELAVIRISARIAVPFPLPVNSEFAMFLYYLILVIFIFSHAHHRRAKKI